jgi:lysophospholipase L1-like esterase
MKNRPLRTHAANLTLAAVSALLTFLVLEIACRAATFWLNRDMTFRAFVASHSPPSGEVSLKDIIRPSRSTDVIFELIPNITQATFLGAELTTDDLGFRGRSRAIEKDGRGVRIVGLGDSVMFGWGVPDGADYLSVFEAKLRKYDPQAGWEVINTAVPGYNTPLEVTAFEEKALRFKPKIVIVGYCDNDLALPRFVRQFTRYHEPYWGVTKFFLRDFVFERIARIRVDETTPRFLRRMRQMTRTPVTDHRMIPPEFAHLSGIEALKRAMRRLRALELTHGFKVVVLFHPSAPESIECIARENGFYVVDAHPYVERFLEKRGIEELIGSPLTLSDSDYHPSVLGHRLIAELLFQDLREQGLLVTSP